MTSDGAAFLDTYLPYLLRKADQTLSAPFYAALKRHGVSRSEWRVLAVLAAIGELPMIELAVEALSPQPTVTHAVGRLEARGLVTRSVGAADRRQRLVSLTAAGVALTDVLIAEARELEACALTDVGDLSTLTAELERLTDLIDATQRGEDGDDEREQ